jgi:hypothetical protein
VTLYRARKKQAEQKVKLAQRDAEAATRELDMIRGLRVRANQLVFELGQHERKNNFVHIVNQVARGLQ